MARFYSRTSVRALLRMHKASTGKVFAATLTPQDGSGAVSYSNCYIWPVTETTARGGVGAPDEQTTGVLWQVGETTEPRVDDSLTDSLDRTWIINQVTTKLNADTNYAVHDLALSRRS